MSHKRKENESNGKEIIFRELPSTAISKENETPQVVKYQYPINNIIQKDYRKINLENLKTVFVCIFHINACFNSSTVAKHPFLEYYLWKYPKSNNSHSDLLVFPFQQYKKNKTVQQISQDILKKLGKTDVIKHGFIQGNKSVHLFFEQKLSNRRFLRSISRNFSTWWVVIDEICNSRRILNFPIHKTVTEIFYKHPTLIYLLDTQNRKLEIPTIGYYGDYSKLLPSIAVFGKRATWGLGHGAYYYFGTYANGVRYGGWNSKYNESKFQNIQITDKFGKYSQGGIIRFILFLGKMEVQLNRQKEQLNNKDRSTSIKKLFVHLDDYGGEWAKEFNSTYYGRCKLKNNFPYRTSPMIVLKSFGQQFPLSMHMLDMSTLKSTWDPYYDKYYIK